MKKKDIKDNIITDNHLKKIILETKITPNENLNLRIMKQIQTETALAKKTDQVETSSITNIIIIMLIISLVVSSYICFIYFGGNQNNAISKEMLFTYIIPICSTLSFIAFIFALDAKIRDKRSKKHSS